MPRHIAQSRLGRVFWSCRRLSVSVFVGLLLITHPPSRTNAQPCEDWTRVDTAAPVARLGHAMVYDSGRQVVVLYGGFTTVDNLLGYIATDDTWEWSAEGWRLAATSGPSARGLHTMAYDDRRGVTVLFGGGAACFVVCRGLSGVTWEWDGDSWSRRSRLGPSPRYVHSMAFDSERGVTVLFGGIDGSGIETSETWEWDGNRWRLRSTEGPPGRPYAWEAVYDPSRRAVVIFDSQARDLWIWTGDEWRMELVPGVWPPRDGRYVTDLARHVVLAVFATEVWEWDGTGWAVRSEFPDGEATLPLSFVVAQDHLRQQTLLFGGERPGRNPTFVDETWILHQPRTDTDADGDVDLADVRDIQLCMGDIDQAGPCATVGIDIDLDQSVTALDFGRCLAELTGPVE